MKCKYIFIGLVLMIVLAGFVTASMARSFIDIEIANVEVVIADITYARWTHAYYANHPELCNAATGDVEWQREWIAKYDNTLAILVHYRQLLYCVKFAGQLNIRMIESIIQGT